MKHSVTCLLFALLPLFSWTQSIVQGEYFFNEDVGIRTPIAINTPGNAVELDLNLALPAGLPDGFNTVYFRFQDDQGKWSFFHPRIFFKKQTENTASPISYLEYFIDNDPGQGAGTPVNVPNATTELTLDFTAELAGLETGFHTLYVRARGAAGQWSMTDRRVFYLKSKENTTLTNLVGLKYFFENETFASDTTELLFETPQPSVELDFTADISALPPDQTYTMFIIAVNEEGQESMVEKRTIRACSTEPPTANFDFIGFGNCISFIDGSTYAESYFWDFGDGATDTVSNPVHEYTAFGVFDVTMIVSSFCKEDTLVKQVTNAGLTGLSIQTGGNYGNVSLDVYGGGFNENAIIFLRQGATIIIPDTTIIVSGNIAHLRFDLRDQPVGQYDVVLIQNNIQDELTSSFTIVEETDEPRFSLEITGRTTIRAGRSSPITFTFSNNSPTDAIGIPFFIVIKGDTTVNLNFDFEFIAPDENDGINYQELLPYFKVDSLYGEAQEAIILPLMVPYLLAGQTGELSIFLEATKDLEIEAWLGDTFYNSPMPEDLVGCLQAVLANAATVAGEVLEEAFLPCISSFVNDGFDFFNNLYQLADGRSTGSEVGTMVWSFAKILESCAFIIPGLNTYTVSIRAIRVILKVVKSGIKIGATGEGLFALRKCAHVIFGTDDSQLMAFIRVVTSIDPNEKTGPTNLSVQNYIRSNQVFNYKIFFENVDSATAAAQEVFVYDTLDLQSLDLSTFALNEIAFGENTRIRPPSGLREYSTLVDLRPNLDLIVRVDAKLNPSSGILFWHFISLDPLSLELTDDPVLGFLPPNNSSPEGEGFVSFNIKPKETLATGATIENKAAIIFDLNEPIITNTHLNTIDDIRPSSEVTMLDPVQDNTVFTIRWSGRDDDSGIRAYDIYVSENNGPFELLWYDVPQSEADFEGTAGSSYTFYSIAKDLAGNIEPGKSAGEASTLVARTDIQVSGAVYLQGAYDPGLGLMRDDLRAGGLLPLSEPFTSLGYAHNGSGGESVQPAVFEVIGPNAIVDWVFLELRDQANSSAVIATRSALLQCDGDIVDVDGVSPVTFDIPADNYYLAVKHRNHLGAMSAVPVALSGTPTIIDFTTDLNNVSGGANGIAILTDGRLGLFSGDPNRNGQVQNTDFSAMALTLGTAGYLPGDLDLNGQVQNTDLQFQLVPNIGRGQQF